jgi:putative SOS response-associated peptidase YedK
MVGCANAADHRPAAGLAGAPARGTRRGERAGTAGAGRAKIAAMCGRYVVAYDPQTLVSGFSLTRVQPFPKRWNVAPQSPVPVVYETREGERVVELMRWGLVPHWARDVTIGHKLNNARSEGVFDKPSFRQAVRRRRCILPASGFYEWQAPPAGQKLKQPWFISPREAPLFAFAGLFEAWRAPGSEEWLLSCCVITTEPNELMARIHDRMPVILPAAQWSAWLARGSTERDAIEPMLQRYPAAAMQAWPVSRAVSKGTAEGEALVEPLAEVATAPAAEGSSSA